MSLTWLFTSTPQTKPTSCITTLETRLENYKKALMDIENELAEIQPVLERQIDKLTAVNTTYNETGNEGMWWPAYKVVSKEIRMLEKRGDTAEKERTKCLAVLRAARSELAAAKEKERVRADETKKIQDKAENAEEKAKETIQVDKADEADQYKLAIADSGCNCTSEVV